MLMRYFIGYLLLGLVPAKAVCCHVVRLNVFNLLAHIFHFFDYYFPLISLFTINLINFYYRKEYSDFFINISVY